jgi:hypothetical protein
MMPHASSVLRNASSRAKDVPIFIFMASARNSGSEFWILDVHTKNEVEVPFLNGFFLNLSSGSWENNYAVYKLRN